MCISDVDRLLDELLPDDAGAYGSSPEEDSQDESVGDIILESDSDSDDSSGASSQNDSEDSEDDDEEDA
jgi:hypothetical protein